ncbi:MAG TPA: flavin reductase family protein [Rectinemataceae bacterium]|nr:flavin reductase family protein [Rectinemataceae bacterium]
MDYDDVPLSRAYELLAGGCLIWVCTKSAAGRYDLAPIAWNCPLDYEPSSRVLFVCDKKHATLENLRAGGSFAIALPTPEQMDLVEKTGSVSGRERDKYRDFGIAARPAAAVDALVPEGVAGWLECRLLRAVEEGSVAVVMGEVLAARARSEAWKERLHYVSESLRYRPGSAL